MYFVRKNLWPGDILAGRNLNPKARQAAGIRALLGSFTNHNALILDHPDLGICIGDTTPPMSSIRHLEVYEELVNSGLYVVRIWRVTGIRMDQGLKASDYWIQHCNGIPYPSRGVMRLWVMRFVNHLPYEIPGRWCTRNTLYPYKAALPPEMDPRYRPDGKLKKNPTPRTMENRLVAGKLTDVTDSVTARGER